MARGSLADRAGWLPAREFASRSGAMNLEQVGPLDVHLLCRFGARFPPRSPRLFSQSLHLTLPKGTFAFTPSSFSSSLPSLRLSFPRATLLYFSFGSLSIRLYTRVRSSQYMSIRRIARACTFERRAFPQLCLAFLRSRFLSSYSQDSLRKVEFFSYNIPS